MDGHTVVGPLTFQNVVLVLFVSSPRWTYYSLREIELALQLAIIKMGEVWWGNRFVSLHSCNLIFYTVASLRCSA